MLLLHCSYLTAFIILVIRWTLSPGTVSELRAERRKKAKKPSPHKSLPFYLEKEAHHRDFWKFLIKPNYILWPLQVVMRSGNFCIPASRVEKDKGEAG